MSGTAKRSSLRRMRIIAADTALRGRRGSSRIIAADAAHRGGRGSSRIIAAGADHRGGRGSSRIIAAGAMSHRRTENWQGIKYVPRILTPPPRGGQTSQPLRRRRAHPSRRRKRPSQSRCRGRRAGRASTDVARSGLAGPPPCSRASAQDGIATRQPRHHRDRLRRHRNRAHRRRGGVPFAIASRRLQEPPTFRDSLQTFARAPDVSR